MNDSYRYEIKFVLNEMNYSIFEKWLYVETSCTKKYPDRHINSLYLDDANYSSVKDNLSGIPDRSKLRLRWYGNNAELTSSRPVLERKIKRGRLGSKRYLPILELEKRISSIKIEEIFYEISKHYQNEGSEYIDFYYPTLLVSYEREYFEDHNNFRITIDKNIRYAIPTMSKKIDDLNWITHNKKILELKFDPEEKDYASELIRPLNLVPTRHSKYLTGLAMFGQANYI